MIRCRGRVSAGASRPTSRSRTFSLTWRHVMNGTGDIVLKRCGCTGESTGRQLAGHCPHLAEPSHGSWYYAVQVTTVGGRKARYRRGGFATREAAAAARQAIIDGSAGQAAAGAWTVARWLRYWLAQAEPYLRPSTLHATATTSTGSSSPASAGSPSPTSPGSACRPASICSPASAPRREHRSPRLPSTGSAPPCDQR